MKVTKAGLKRFFEELKGKRVLLSQVITTEYFVNGNMIHKSEQTPFNNLERTVKELKSNAIIFLNENGQEGRMYTDQQNWYPDYLDSTRCETISIFEGEHHDIEHEGIIYDAVQYKKVKRSIYQAG
jgi:hypothetical protein